MGRGTGRGREDKVKSLRLYTVQPTAQGRVTDAVAANTSRSPNPGRARHKSKDSPSPVRLGHHSHHRRSRWHLPLHLPPHSHLLAHLRHDAQYTTRH